MADKTIELKTGKQLVEWIGTRFDEVTDRLGLVEGKGEKIETELGRLATLTKDANRTHVPGLTEKVGRLPFTKSDFVKYGMKAAIAAPLPIEKKSDGSWTAGDGPLATLQAKSDDLRLLAVVMRKNTREEVRELKFYRDEYLPAYREVEAMVKAAFDIQTTGEGLEYVATDLSGSLVEMVRMERRVASLFEELPMPHGVLTVPSWLTDAQAYGFAEVTADTGGTPIDDGLPSGFTSNFTLTAKGIGLALTTSRFMEEDSVIPWLQLLRRAGIQALVNGEEDVFINGDTTATHMDADVAAVTRHVAKQLTGLRYVGLLAANPALTPASGAYINSDADFRDVVLKCLGKMDKYGVKPGDLAFLVPAVVNAQLLSVEAFLTMYARGSAATNANGIIQSPFGWDYTPTAYLKTNLASSGVNTSGTTTVDKTSAMLVHKPSWKKGRVREITVQLLDQTRALYDQDQLVFTMRQAFRSARKMDGTEPHVGLMVDIGAA